MRDSGLAVVMAAGRQGSSLKNLTPGSPTRRPDPPHAEPASVLEGIIEQLSLQSGRKPVLVGLRSPAPLLNQ